MVKLSRRHVLAALGTVVAAAASTTLGPESTVHALATPKAPAGGLLSASNAPPKSLVAVARAGLQRLGARVAQQDVVAVADFSRPSSEPRLHLVDTTTGAVESFLVAHGRGSDPARTGWLSRFSNAPQSDCTSEGAYLTGGYYVGEHGRSLRLLGQDPTNSNALARAIVIHPAWYASPQIVRLEGMLGRSEGCFAVSQADIARVLERLSPGHLLIATRLT